jgi:hydrogenase expression/formation protein HypC
MCIGWPMQVQAVRPGHATARRGSITREVRTALVEPVAAGDWLLVFLDDAREQLTPARAAEIDATLALVEAALSGAAPAAADAAVGFDLPSSWTPDQLEAYR